MANTQWPYSGSRWWKFDFHTHTPASMDTQSNLTHQDWLLRYMAEQIDCVAITDHNSGAWIDPLKTTYAQMKEQADQGRPLTGFRELTLFPGVEISVSTGFHLLALFDPSATTRTITDLLAVVGYHGTDGNSDKVTNEGPEKIIEEVLKAKGIPIPAHADGPTMKSASKLDNGSQYTWVKMAHPNIEGLRLALFDGNEVSIRRSDGEVFNPFRVPAHIIMAIEIEQARYMGHGQPLLGKPDLFHFIMVTRLIA
ncbi:MAG: hypothetical protein HQL93_14165 [Magnetococcales bacterium]|nr:hypothetical protein [Magnetococcales bacterium]